MKNISLYINCVFCMVVLPVMIMIFPVERWFHNFPAYIISLVTWLYVVYFVNRFFTVKYLFAGSKRRWCGVVIIVFSLLITYIFSIVSLYTPKQNIHDVGISRLFPNVMQYQQAVWTLFMIVETFSFAVGLLTQANVQRARRKDVESERDRAVIELYKARIKPHFMFNTLNSLYGLFLTGDKKALETLEKFISMMRHIHTTAVKDKIRIADEKDYIKKYVDLQSLRLNGMTSVTLTMDIENEDLMIPPMVLTTFVENCFKHGVSSVEKSRIAVSIKEKDGILEFITFNRIFRNGRVGEHLGIENCRKRLALFYPGHHEIIIKNDGVEFIVKLTVDLSYDKMCGY